MPSLSEMLAEKEKQEAVEASKAKVAKPLAKPRTARAKQQLELPTSEPAEYERPEWVGVDLMRGLIKCADPNHSPGEWLKQNLAKSTAIFKQQMATREGLAAFLKSIAEIAYGKQ